MHSDVNLTDEQLAQLLSRGQREMLTPLVERHHARLLGYLYRLSGGERTLAEDWVQESFMRLLRQISQYVYPRPFKPYLYAIATNIARDHFKSAASRTGSLPLDYADHMVADQPSPEQTVAADQQVQQVILTLRQLPDQQRETVILRYYEEWSLAEIAAALDVPIGTVKSRLSLALKRLRELLREEVNPYERET
ncbi:MAG: RNA polymerase sigma factor [Anaerolineae bacterium]|nr:RNA polymerase sigma factor [Anaerolineae bacterium]